MDFNKKLNEKLKLININISEDEIENFKIYMELLLEWNEKINLTAITDENDIVLKHFVDSLTIKKYISENEKIIDIGTGAGFPGIPLAIMNKNNEITLMDSLNKRIVFLNDVIDKLKLNNVKAIHSRAEELARNKNHREKYDVAVSRAVANLSTLVEYMLPFVRIGGKCICMKGPNIEEELKNAKKAIKELGGEVIKIENFKLPESDNERNIVIIKKIRETSSKYPRKSGTPSKEPIK